ATERPPRRSFRFGGFDGSLVRGSSSSGVCDVERVGAGVGAVARESEPEYDHDDARGQLRHRLVSSVLGGAARAGRLQRLRRDARLLRRARQALAARARALHAGRPSDNGCEPRYQYGAAPRVRVSGSGRDEESVGRVRHARDAVAHLRRIRGDRPRNVAIVMGSYEQPHVVATAQYLSATDNPFIARDVQRRGLSVFGEGRQGVTGWAGIGRLDMFDPDASNDSDARRRYIFGGA